MADRVVDECNPDAHLSIKVWGEPDIGNVKNKFRIQREDI
jgi:hypothetical protein